MKTKENASLTRAEKQSEIISIIQKRLKSFGYSEIFLPLYENYEILKNTVWNFKDENIIRFIDRNSGKSLVLRPDFTPQVCRTVANYMPDAPKPLKLSYKGRVFRNVNTNKGIKSEKYQMGCELFGASEFFGDYESIIIAFSVMNDLGLTNHKIVLGDANLLKLVLNLSRNSKEYELCLTGKKFYLLDSCVTKLKLNNEEAVFLKYFPYAFGDLEILNKLKEKCFFNKDISKRIDYIITLFEKLIGAGVPKEQLIFDAGETRGMNYYTGINFNIVHTERGVSVGGGGRYDKLMNYFGMNLTSCGVAFNIEELLSFYNLNDDDIDFDYLVIGINLLSESEKLRNQGYSVFWIENKEDLEKLKSWFKFKNIVSEV
jgi:ATP phosphoribosyltransferase regulatory subunit